MYQRAKLNYEHCKKSTGAITAAKCDLGVSMTCGAKSHSSTESSNQIILFRISPSLSPPTIMNVFYRMNSVHSKYYLLAVVFYLQLD